MSSPHLRTGPPHDSSLEPWVAFLAPILFSACLISVLYTGGLDDGLTRPFYDAEQRRWPLQGAWFPAVVMHRGGRNLVFLTALAGLLCALLGGKLPRLRPHRRAGLFVCVAIALSAASVSWLKDISPDPSPWDAAGYGGEIVHDTFFRSHSPTGAMGHASPGAHAAGAFALMCFYYCLRRTRPRAAWATLVGGFMLGSLYGVVQVMRGAHFPSHNYWSCIIVWCICTLLYWVPFRGRLYGDPALEMLATEL